jgi:hypothetical protein
MAYLTLATYRDLSLAPPALINRCETDHPGWVLGQLEFWSAWLDSRLKKRYAAPFAAPPNTPPVVLGWLVRILDAELYLKIGINPRDEQAATVVQERAADAKAEVKEAADSKEGLFELPLRADTPAATDITRAGPLGYTEQSPYSWTIVQRDAAADEGQGIG